MFLSDTAFQQESIGAAFGYVVIVLNQIAGNCVPSHPNWKINRLADVCGPFQAYLGMAFPHTMFSLGSESFVVASPFDPNNGGNKYEFFPSPVSSFCGYENL